MLLDVIVYVVEYHCMAMSPLHAIGCHGGDCVIGVDLTLLGGQCQGQQVLVAWH